jgi:hypothetical protein
MNCVHGCEETERTGHHHRGDAETRRFAMRQRRRRPSGRLGQEEERAEHKPRHRSRWLVLSPFLLLPAREARPTLTHRALTV